MTSRERSPKAARWPAVAALAGALMASLSAASSQAAPPGSSAGHGFAIAAVEPGSLADRAGLKAGDLLLEWRREDSPPANSFPAAGWLLTPFDLQEVLVEQAPRGALVLYGRRGTEGRRWPLPAGGSLERWGARLASNDPAWRESERALALDWARVFEEADAAFARAVALLEMAERRGSAALLLEAWGRSLAKRTLWDEALKVQGRAIEQASAPGGTDLARARALSERGETYRLRAEYPSALADHRAAARLRAALAPGSLDLASSWYGLGRSLVEGEGSAEGIEKLAEAERLQRRLDPAGLERVRTLDYLGVLRWERGERAEGERDLQEAFALARRWAPLGYEEGRVLLHLGRLRSRRSDALGAEGYLRSALAVWRALPGDYANLYNLAGCLTSLSQLALAEGDFEAAVAYGGEAVETQARINPRSLGVAEALETQGYVARELGDVPLARDSFRRAVALRRSLSSAPYYLAASLSYLGRLEVLAGESPAGLDHAEALLNEALALYDKAGETQAEGDAYADLLRGFAALASRRGRAEEAIGFAERAQAIRNRLAPQTTGEVETLAELGRLERAAGRLEPSISHLCGAAGLLDRIGGLWAGADRARTLFSASYSGVYKDCLSALLRAGRPEEAFQVLETGRTRSLVDRMAARQLTWSELPEGLRDEAEAIRKEWEETQDEVATLAPEPPGPKLAVALRRLVDLQRRKDGLALAARGAAPRFAALYFPPASTVREARASLPRGTLLLEYSWSEGEGWLFALSARDLGGPGLRVYPLVVDGAMLRREVETFRSLLADPGSAGSGLSARARRLYRLLLGPAAKEVKKARRLVIVPDGPLYALPFAALETAPGRYLIERKEVSSATSAAALRGSAGRGSGGAHRRKGGNLRLSIFGDPRREGEGGLAGNRKGSAVRVSPARRTGGRGLEALPGSRREALGVARLFSGARTYLGAAATERRAKSVGEESDILHFATHALLDEQLPLNSAIVLSAPTQGEPVEDGLLRSWEIVETMRLDAELVTLSGCETALGKELAGEGLASLARSFQLAGARSVLASLWAVGDLPTASFMVRFYGHLRAGRSEAAALRRAQLESLRQPGSRPPFYWAPFTLLGSAGPP